MILRHVRTLASLVTCAVLASCSSASDITAFEPLVGGEPVASTLQQSIAPWRGTPLLEVSGIIGGVDAVWLASGGCDTASATASRAGAVIEIKLERSVLNGPCSAIAVGQRYAVRVSGLTPGRYEVRFVDVFAHQPPVEIGRSSIYVLQYGLD
jgi:hypothetical protein